MKHETLNQLIQSCLKKPCGNRGKYKAGCRCALCRASNTKYVLQRERLNRAGIRNPWVPVDECRRHLAALSQAGIGYKTVSDYCGLGRSTLFKIITGSVRSIRQSNAERILAVDSSCINGGTLIKSGRFKRMVSWMISEGFTHRELARRMGYKSNSLQLKSKLITATKAMKIEKFYNALRAGDDDAD